MAYTGTTEGSETADEILGITPGTRITFKPVVNGVCGGIELGVDVPDTGPQKAEYLGEGMFRLEPEDRTPDDRDGLTECFDKEQFDVGWLA